MLIAINKGRQDWTSNFSIENGKVSGSLFCNKKKIRDFKNIKIKNNRFNVDIGTGSGVKVTFELGE